MNGILIIKKGEHGVLAIHPDGLIALPAYPTETVVDPTGCGDTFAGTLASRLALGSGEVSLDELKFALIHATVTASFTSKVSVSMRCINSKRKITLDESSLT